MNDEDLDHLAADAAELLLERYADGLCASERIHLELEPGPDRLRVSLFLTDGLVDTSIEFAAALPGPADMAAIHLLLDFLDGVLDEHLASERRAMPRLDPAPYRYEGRTIYLSGQFRRPDLEAQADDLLAAGDLEGEEPS